MSNISDEHKKEVDIIQEFNQIYTEIVKTLQKMCKEKKYKGMKKLKKLEIDMTFDAYLRVVREDLQFALTEFGPLIFQHREKIKVGDDQFFVKKNYNLFMQTIAQKYDFDYQYCLDLIELTKEVYIASTQETKNEVKQKVENLLSLYCQYGMLK